MGKITLTGLKSSIFPSHNGPQIGPKIGVLGPYFEPLLEGSRGPNHIDGRLGLHCNYGVLDPILGTPILGVPRSGVPPDLGVWAFGPYPQSSLPIRWGHHSGMWPHRMGNEDSAPGGAGQCLRSTGPLALCCIGPTALWAVGPAAPIPLVVSQRESTCYRDQPTHTTRARVMCARARARAPAE